MNLKKISKYYIQQRYNVLILLIYALSRYFYYLAGVRFDTTSLVWFWQFLDPELLKCRFLESIFYLHAQPPLFNILLGLVLNLFPGNEQIGFWIIFMIFGLVLYYGLYYLIAGFGVSPVMSFLFSTLFITSPACICYENWLFFTHILLVFTVLTYLSLHKFFQTSKSRYLFFFFLSLSLMCLIRATYHLGYFLLVLIILVVLSRKNFKKIILCSLFPMFLLLSVYLKNYILFNTFSSFSWMGMNLSYLITEQMPESLVEKLIKEGKLSKASLIRTQGFIPSIDNFSKEYKTPAKFKNIPVLSEPIKSTGAINTNNILYVKISSDYLKDVLYLLFNYPKEAFKVYFPVIQPSWEEYFRSSTRNNFFIQGNLSKVKKLANFYDKYFSGEISGEFKAPFLKIFLRVENDYYFIKCGIPLLIIYSFFLLFKQKFQYEHKILLLLILINLIYVMFSSNLTTHGENQRYRYETDPLYLVLFVLFFNNVILSRIRNVLKSNR